MWNKIWCPTLKTVFIGTFLLTGVIVLFVMYHQSIPSQNCPPPLARAGPWGHNAQFPSMEEIKKAAMQKPNVPPKNKPLLLLWFWPENKKFDLQDCATLFGIDGCSLTDDRSLFSKAHGVLFFHRGINDDLSNMPTSPRPKFQRWIWFNPDPPSSTRTIEGIRGLFNLTMSYRKNADIQARWQVSFKLTTDAEFLLPKKKHLLCWIVDEEALHSKSRESYRYYRELVKHIHVEIFFSTEFDKSEDYFLTISSCKFYLSFENSVEPDHITETLNGPLAAGTVPIVLGPSRNNYEDFVPGSSFIHVNDFSGPSKLSEYLVMLDGDFSAYMRYFDWRKYYIARPHFIEDDYKYAHSICQACYYLSIKKVYRVVPDLYKWFFG